MFLMHNKEARKDAAYLEEHVKSLIEKSGGTVLQLRKWDERKLAYPIKGVTHGVYVLTVFSGTTDTVAQLRGEVRLSSLVLRHLTLKLTGSPDKPIETFQEMQARLAGAIESRDADSGRGDGFRVGAGVGGERRRAEADTADGPKARLPLDDVGEED
jgi:small subunit ribosomal protein S6